MSIRNLETEIDGSIDLESEANTNGSVSETQINVVADPIIRDSVEDIVDREDSDFRSLSQFVRVAIREFVNQPLDRVNGEKILELVPTGTAKTNRQIGACVSRKLKKQVKYVKESPITPYRTYFEVCTVAIVWFCWKENRA